MFPVVDGRNVHAERTCCLFVTQSPAHDQIDGGSFVVVETLHGRSKFSGANEFLLNFTRYDLGFWSLICPSRTPKILPYFAKTTISVISLSNQILTDSVEVTHCHHSSFKIFHPQQPKKHLLSDIRGSFGSDQSTQESEDLGMMGLVEVLHHQDPRCRRRMRLQVVSRSVER